jgi:hypothetical protein
MEHWRRVHPQRLAELDDPQGFFAGLGQDVAEAIEEMARMLAGPRPPRGETYLQRLRRLNTARATAESHVIRQMVLLVEEPPPPPRSPRLLR